MGFALTLPKCVSVLELLGIDPEVTAAIITAAEVCLELVEFLAAPLRQKPDGLHRNKVVGFGALQRLTDGSPPKPHRHLHLGVLSLAWNDDDKFKRVTSANLEVISHAGDLLMALFQHQVARELTKLGYEVKREKHSFTIAGFPEPVIEKFNAGARTREARNYLARPAGTSKAVQEQWRDMLNPEERQVLTQLRQPGRPVPAAPSFDEVLKLAAERALQKDFFQTSFEIAVQALRMSFGGPSPEPGRLARWVTGEPLAGLEAVKFELDGQWCWGTRAGLAEERRFLDLIRGASLAETGWLGQEHPDTWWGRQLFADRHRVAVLRAGLKYTDVALLESQFLGSAFLIKDRDLKSVRERLPMYLSYLTGGRRLLFLNPVDAPRQPLWLKQLPAAAGVPVLWENQPHRLNLPLAHDLSISFAPGKAVEVFAARYSQKKSAHLLAGYSDPLGMNLEVRRLRAAHSKSKRVRKPVQRLVLMHPKEKVRPGHLVQFEQNVAGFRSTELLTVLEMRDDQMRVERPGGIQALLDYDLYPKYQVYQSAKLELERGDRIRLTRNHGPDAVKTGLRRGRRFRVESVLPDGTALLSGRRVLPAKAGHWEYGFCLTFADPPPRRGVVVCGVEDLRHLQLHGWLRPGIELVICAADPAEVEQALIPVLNKARQSRCRAGTDDISVALAAAAFGHQPEAKPAAIATPAQPKTPVGLEF